MGIELCSQGGRHTGLRVRVSIVQEVSPFDAKHQIKIGFIEVYNAESMNLEVDGVFEDQYIHIGFPPFQDVAVVDAVVDY